MSVAQQFGSTMVLLLTAATLVACDGHSGSNTADAANTPPPTSNSLSVELWPGSRTIDGTAISGTFTQRASATLTPSGLKQADLFVDGSLIGTSTGGTPDSPRNPVVFTYFFDWNTGNVPDGPHALMARATDRLGQTADSPLKRIYVRNHISIPIALSPNEIFPNPNSTASGNGNFVVNLATGEVSGDITIANMSATAVHIHNASLLSSGSIVLTLVQVGATNRWVLPTGSVLTTTATTASVGGSVLGGGFYIDVHSLTYPDGELRHQLAPRRLPFAFGHLDGTQVVPPVSTVAGAISGAMFDTERGYEQVLVRMSAISPTQVRIYDDSPSSGPTLIFSLVKDVVPDFWSGSISVLDPNPLPTFNTGTWFINVASPAYPSGELRGPVPIVPLPAAKLSELQATIFTPKCASCHDGTATTLPGVLDLRDGHTFDTLANTLGYQQTIFRLVEPGRSEFSYLMHKIEGVYSIAGAHMPTGGPYLDDASAFAVASWIDSGAPNN